MRKGVRVDISAQMFDDLLELALSGDAQAASDYRDAASRLAHRMNQQLRSAEKAGALGQGYIRAEHFLSQFGKEKPRFREGLKGADLWEISDQVDQMLIYQKSKDYSISETLKIAEAAGKIGGALTAAGVNVNNDDFVAYQMADLFTTDAWKEAKKAHGRSTDLIQSAYDAFRQGKTVDDLIDAYDDYQRNRDGTDLINTWEKFAKWI